MTSSSWCDGTLISAMCPVAGSAGTDPSASGFTGLAAAMASAFGQLLQALLGFWTGPDAVGALDAPAGLVHAVTGYTTSLVAVTATIGVIIAGTRLAITSSGLQAPARELARGLVVLALVAGGGAAAVQTVWSVLDAAADGLLTHGFDGHPIGSQLVALTDLQQGGIAPGVTFLLGLLGALSAFAQLFVMVVRGPVLAVLVGVLPIAAATTMTGGTGYVRRLTAWIVSLTAYKFVAGLLYAAAFLAVGGTSAADPGTGRVTGVVTGIALIIVAAGALPALVRVLSPAVDAVLTGGGRVDAVTTVSTGAIRLGGRGQGPVSGPPSDAGPRTGPGLVRMPSGSLTAGTTHGRANERLGGPLPGRGGQGRGNAGPAPEEMAERVADRMADRAAEHVAATSGQESG